MKLLWMMLFLVGCANPRYGVGDCAKTIILNDKIKILQVNDFTYFYAMPPSTHVYIARHEAVERTTILVSCEE
jgi:hypothetical protein